MKEAPSRLRPKQIFILPFLDTLPTVEFALVHCKLLHTAIDVRSENGTCTKKKNEAQNQVNDVFHGLTVEHTQQSCLLKAIQKVRYTEFS